MPVSLLSEMPRFQKERFLKSYSEDDFRDKVIRPLFYRLGYQKGDDLCGPSEEGKDALFSEKDKLGNEIYTAVQTKKGNLNLASKASQNVTNAVAQLRTVLVTSISVLSAGKKIFPTQVILIASGKINKAAREHIVTELNNEPRIRFLDSDDLIPHLDGNYPELWSGINADIIPYFRALKKMIEGGSQTDSGEDSALDVFRAAAAGKGYVTLKLFRTKQKIKKRQGEITKTPDFEEKTFKQAIRSKQKRLLIVGDAGSGKSTALLRCVYDIARDGVNSKGKYKIPVFVRAADYCRAGSVEFLEYCYQSTSELAGSGNMSCFTAEDLANGRVIFFVDGLDEIATTAKRSSVMSAVESTIGSYPLCKVVVTSRPNTSLKDVYKIHSYMRYDISPISVIQAEKMLKDVKSGKTVGQVESKELLRRMEAVHGIELNPLLVTVFAATSNYSRQDIPANITELFKKYTELLLGRWDESKGIGQQYQAPLKDFLLQKLSLRMHSRGTTSIERGEFEAIIENELKSRGHEVDCRKIVGELYRSDLFRIFENRIEFRHLLLQEFFAGRGIPSLDFIKDNIHKEWWRRAVVFYFGERPEAVGELRDAAKGFGWNAADQSKVLDSAATVGLALQACYLSQVVDKLDVWKQVVMALGVVTAQKHLTGDRVSYPITEFAFNFLLCRDAVALSDIAPEYRELLEWARSEGEISESEDAMTFWLVAGLLESGRMDCALDIISSKEVINPRYLLGIYMSAVLAIEVRYLEPSQRDAALKIRDSLREIVAGEARLLMDEFGSQLLELRQGKVEAIGDESQTGRSGSTQ